MSIYRVELGADGLWHVLKDGYLLTATHSRLDAERISAALERGLTPTPGSFNAVDVDAPSPISISARKSKP